MNSATNSSTNTQIRWMFRSDTDVVSEMREKCMDGLARDFNKVLSSPSCILKVAVVDGKVSGFINYKNEKKRIKILELVVLPRYRRRGVASELLALLIHKASSSKSIEALVSEQNLEAQLFLKKCGLKASKIIHSKNGPFYKFVMKCQKESC